MKKQVALVFVVLIVSAMTASAQQKKIGTMELDEMIAFQQLGAPATMDPVGNNVTLKH